MPIVIGIGIAFVIIMIICAIAPMESEYCRPEQNCGNCDRFVTYGSGNPKICDHCKKYHPYAPDWKPIKHDLETAGQA